MTTDVKNRWRALVTLSIAGFLWSASPELPTQTHKGTQTTRVIVQGDTTAAASAAVTAVGGEVTHELGIIKGVGARMTPTQLRRLERRHGTLRIQADRTTNVSGARKPDRRSDKREWERAERKAISTAAEFERVAERSTKQAERAAAKAEKRATNVAREEAKQAAADARQWEKTLKSWNKQWAKDAFLKGTKPTFFPGLVGAHALHDQQVTGDGVTIAIVDTGLWNDKGLRQKGGSGRSRVLATYDAQTGAEVTDLQQRKFGDDPNGHGSHIASVAASGRKIRGEYNGIAPDAALVVVRAFGEQGQGSYADVIRGLDWIWQNQARLGIRVVNLSFSAPPQSHYWDDPINQAVMRLWQAGIVVVASAGNTGPDAMTIGVPGNVPYIVTVGAMTDSYTPDDRTDDRLTWFTAAGPTHEGFVKPDLVAPGGHLRGVMPKDSYIPNTFPQFHDGKRYFAMSGTSQATAVVTGIVALMLQFDPDLTPDEVKFQLQAASRPAVDDAGNLTFSVFQQGAGLVDAWRAVFPQVEGSANQGLDLAADLEGTTHYRGRANRDADGNYYIEGLDGFMWNDGFMWSDSLSETMSINTWVGQQ
jgi:subtilisin family serine protease